MNISCIYKILSKSTSRFYIGSAKDFKIRKSGHLCDLRNNKHHSRFLQRTYNKYGATDISFEIIEEVIDLSELLKREQHYIDTLKPEFNTLPTAGNSLGAKMSDSTKEKLRHLNTGNKNKFFGRKHSEETKQKISVKQNGKYAGANNYFYGKRFTGEKNYMFGRTHTKEAIAKIKEKRKLQITTDETRLKMSLHRRGANNHAAKSVLCVSNGITYSTVSEAGEALGVWRQDISKVCRGKLKTTGGYKFQYT
jgi:group I intron endonuclease